MPCAFSQGFGEEREDKYNYLIMLEKLNRAGVVPAGEALFIGAPFAIP